MKNLQHLLCFAAVIEADNFADAARALGSSRSWVSRSIAQLEAELDVRLFYRTTRRVVVTEAGALLYETVRSILDLTERTASELSARSKEVSGVLRVSSPTAFGERYILPLLEPLLEQHPRLDIEMNFDDYNTDLLGAGYDIILRHGHVLDSDHVMRTLCALPVILVASPAYLARRGVPTTPAELQAHNSIVVHRASRKSYRWRLVNVHDADAPPVMFHPEGRFHVFGHLDACFSAAVHGLGISLADPQSVLPYLRDGTLRTVLPGYRIEGEFEDTVVQLIYPHRERLPLKVRVFVDLLVAHAPTWAAVSFDPRAFAAEDCSRHQIGVD